MNLSGIVVLDLSALLPGPYCTSLLASMGAEVWKIERPGTGEFGRSTPGSFATLNSGKRSVTLDFARPEGKVIFRKMTEKADVVVEGFRPGVVARLGVDYATIREINPQIVYCSISGFGQDGPYRDKPGHDVDYQALTGALLTGEHPKSPGQLGEGSVPSLVVSDLSSAVFAALGIVSALLGRQRTGEGSYVDISMTDCVMSWVALADMVRVPGSSRRMDVALPHYGVFETRDGKYMSLGVSEDKFWKTLCRLIGREDWADLNLPSRVKRADEISTELSRILREKDREEWLILLDANDVNASPVNTFEEAKRDPHFVHRRVIAEMADHAGSPLSLIRNPVLSPTIELAGKPAPKVGEHSEEMLLQLGYRQEEIESFRAQGII